MDPPKPFPGTARRLQHFHILWAMGPSEKDQEKDQSGGEKHVWIGIRPSNICLFVIDSTSRYYGLWLSIYAGTLTVIM